VTSDCLIPLSVAVSVYRRHDTLTIIMMKSCFFDCYKLIFFSFVIIFTPSTILLRLLAARVSPYLVYRICIDFTA